MTFTLYRGMRFILISDSHTLNSINYIYEYIKKKVNSWKIDFIFINGDVLGENEVREGYGFNYNKTLFNASLDKQNMLKNIAPNYENLLKIRQVYERGIKRQDVDLEMSFYIKQYVEYRYDDLFEILKKIMIHQVNK